jgi:hypothetical protein
MRESLSAVKGSTRELTASRLVCATLPTSAPSSGVGRNASVARSSCRAARASAHVREEECLDRLIPIGERHFRRAITEYVEHYHRERNHQGIENALIAGTPATGTVMGRIHRRSRLGGLLNYYDRAA